MPVSGKIHIIDKSMGLGESITLSEFINIKENIIEKDPRGWSRDKSQTSFRPITRRIRLGFVWQ
jgi:hypothetical protein